MAKYCTQCGRKLEDSEVCNCTSQNAGNVETPDSAHMPGEAQQDGRQDQPGGYTKEAEWVNRQKNAIVSGTKSMFSEILLILKSPVSRVRQISASNSATVGTKLIIAKAVVFLIVVVAALLMTANQVNAVSYGLLTADMPYFQVIIITLILTLGSDFLESVILKTITGAFNGVTTTNTMINVIGARAVFDTFMLLIFVILGLMAGEVALGSFVLLSPLIVYIQFASYQGCVRMNEDKKAYVYFVAKLCMSTITFLIIYLMARTFVDSLAGSIIRIFF